MKPSDCCHQDAHKPAPPLSAGAAVEWVCPMHPEVVSDKPGPCPKCGMALEPRQITAGAAEDPELKDLTRRLVVSAPLGFVVLILGMPHLVPPLMPFAESSAGRWLMASLSAPVVLWAGWPLWERAVASIRTRSPNMFTLIGLGTFAAFLSSVLALAAPSLFPVSMRDTDGNLPLYFETAALLTVLVLMGQVLEGRARRRTGEALRSLLKLQPDTAFRITAGGGVEEIPLAEVQVGDRLRVRAGDRVPVDGKIVSGSGSIDESMVTGESVPVEKNAGDSVTAGTVNGPGAFEIAAERVGSQTLLARIVESVAEAQRSRAPSQRLADAVSAFFVPGVVGIALLTFVIWAFVGPDPKLAHALVNSVAVLIVACPCALGLATPVSVMVALGRAASAGVLFRNAEALEKLADVDVLVLDKTGTLTEGKPRVTAVVTQAGYTEMQILQWAASLAAGSSHPLSEALLQRASVEKVELLPVEGFESVPGQGLRGRIGAVAIATGRESFVGRTPVGTEDSSATTVAVGKNGEIVGRVELQDPLKPTTAAALKRLKDEGISIVMLTGDRLGVAKRVAGELQIDQFAAGLLPADKIAYVKRLQKEGRRVAMAGDGVNDAPALAAADVGIAMGTGSGVAIESAPVTLVKGDLGGIARARAVSRAARKNIRQNLFFAFVYNAAGVPVAAGLLYPFTGMLMSPVLAGVAMSFSSVSVIANALRLRRVRFD